MRRLTSFFAASFFLCMLVVPAHPVLARQTELVAYSETPASDGSVQLILDFDGFAASSQVVHEKRNGVKVLLFGVERGKRLPGIFDPAGEILSAKIAPYERLIRLVDTPQRSVLFQTQIVELTQTGEYDLGINYSPNGQPLPGHYAARPLEELSQPRPTDGTIGHADAGTIVNADTIADADPDAVTYQPSERTPQSVPEGRSPCERNIAKRNSSFAFSPLPRCLPASPLARQMRRFFCIDSSYGTTPRIASR